MIALKLLPIIEVIIILCEPMVYSIPIYGTKRYSQFDNPSAYYSVVRSYRHPINYYELYPSSQNYPAEYYHAQDSYPIYYPRTSKYEVYQAVLPYYQDDYSPYGGYDSQDMIRQIEREEREEAQPIGHEVMYENEYGNPDYYVDNTKAAFMQNLMLANMYQTKQSQNQDKDYLDSYNYDYDYDQEDHTEASYYTQEDKDVEDLKNLAMHSNEKHDERENTYFPHWYKNEIPTQRVAKNLFTTEKKRISVNQQIPKDELKPVSDRKTIVKITTTSEPATQAPITEKVRGQKEVVMMRPAIPVKNPFSSQIMDMMTKSGQQKRTPSVYQTIKHMLDMEKSLEQRHLASGLRPQMKKRIVTSEDSLIKQLSVLKRAK